MLASTNATLIDMLFLPDRRGRGFVKLIVHMVARVYCAGVPMRCAVRCNTVSVLCTDRMSGVAYREFVVATLESLSAKSAEKLGRDAPQGLARAAAEEMTGEKRGQRHHENIMLLRELLAGSDQGRRNSSGRRDR